jgi:hypothetical protein
MASGASARSISSAAVCLYPIVEEAKEEQLTDIEIMFRNCSACYS